MTVHLDTGREPRVNSVGHFSGSLAGATAAKRKRLSGSRRSPSFVSFCPGSPPARDRETRSGPSTRSGGWRSTGRRSLSGSTRGCTAAVFSRAARGWRRRFGTHGFLLGGRPWLPGRTQCLLGGKARQAASRAEQPPLPRSGLRFEGQMTVWTWIIRPLHDGHSHAVTPARGVATSASNPLRARVPIVLRKSPHILPRGGR